MSARRVLVALAALVALGATAIPADADQSNRLDDARHASLLSSGLSNGFGSTVGPDGMLYVTESAVGRVTRIDPRTGAKSTFASGLPTMNPAIGIGGAMDVAF